MDRTVKTRKQRKPCNSDRVCSDHFVDGQPTVTHPFLELKLVYEKQTPQPRREIFKRPVQTEKAKKHIAAETVQTQSPFRTPPSENQEQHPEFPLEHQYCLLPGREKCGGCLYKVILIQKYQKKIKYLVGQNRKLKTRKTPFKWRIIKSDHKMNFFTG